jgi:Holliday junction resolvase RusA-like endonuclease
MKFTIMGHVPGKKNAYMQTKDGRRFKPADVKKQIDWITWQIKAETGNIAPLDKPSIRVHFICDSGRADLDNKYTTIQDCLVKAGILINDNLKHLDHYGPVSGEVGEPERVEIEII